MKLENKNNLNRDLPILVLEDTCQGGRENRRIDIAPHSPTERNRSLEGSEISLPFTFSKDLKFAKK
ncbi:MAG: hypothetical protein ACKVOU_14705 [Cytophagales bacterium]